ncbi:MAG: tetratricopeptide repeat protein, partial [Planctomycetota bacterium]|nr:tetratricopeptide repeat protein [Planctomycetota bacterium]
MDSTHSELELAIEQHRKGELSEAIATYRRVSQSQPRHWETRYLLATALLQTGEFRECVDLLAAVVEERADPDAQNNLGVAYKALGEWEQAARAFETVIRAHPEYSQAFFNLGMLMADRGLNRDAEKCLRRGLELNSDDAEMKAKLADVVAAQSRWSDAEAMYREILAGAPGDTNTRVSLAYTLARQEKLDGAIHAYQQVLHAQPDHAAVHNSLSFVFERQGRLDEAIDAAQRAINIDRNFADGFNNLGIAFRSRHELDQAESAFRQALSLRADFPLAEFNLATTLLTQERYAEGWPGYARYRDLFDSPVRQFDQPLWDGQRITGNTLLVHADQGYGDAIQFVRFLAATRIQADARIVLLCPEPLKPLFAELETVDVVVGEDEVLPPVGFHIPLTFLPILMQADAQTIPHPVPYLTAPKLRPPLQSVLAALPPRTRKVGIVWRGNPAQARDVHRSCSLQAFAPLASLSEVTLISLQTDDPSQSKIADVSAGFPIVDVGGELRDFADTAAVINELDLIVTVDTAIAHLAGALGAKTWLLLSHTPDWRWQLGRDDSPWYPHTRLFRQPNWGDWDSVVARVCRELA